VVVSAVGGVFGSGEKSDVMVVSGTGRWKAEVERGREEKAVDGSRTEGLGPPGRPLGRKEGGVVKKPCLEEKREGRVPRITTRSRVVGPASQDYLKKKQGEVQSGRRGPKKKKTGKVRPSYHTTRTGDSKKKKQMGPRPRKREKGPTESQSPDATEKKKKGKRRPFTPPRRGTGPETNDPKQPR